MLRKSKGSILVTTVIIFSIVIILAMTSIGVSYNNLSIFNLDYKDETLKQHSYGAMEIVHSNILREVNLIKEYAIDEDDFYTSFSGLSFINNIKDISKCKIKNVIVSIPSRISINREEKSVDFEILITIKDGNYIKKLKSKVKILNPFNEDLSIDDKTDIVKLYNYKEI